MNRSSLFVGQLLCLFGVFLVTGCDSGPEAGENPRAILLGDHRVADLLRRCTQSGFYSRDVSDMIPILIDKLEHGKTEPLKRAKEELGSLGAEAAVALDRLVDRHATNPMLSPLVENAIDAAGFNLSDEGHQVLLKGLQFPQESIRRQALIGFSARHARPEDFEILLERVEGFETAELRRIAVRALFRASRKQAEQRVLGWLETDTQKELWQNSLPLLAESTDPGVQARCAGLFAKLPVILAMHVAAPAARGGDEAALAFLREKLQPETPQNLRTLAVQAFGKAAMYDELARPSKEDPAEPVRVIALDMIAQADDLVDAETRIAHGLDDPSPQVRGLVLKHLVAMGNADARARVLAMLGQEPAQLQTALHAITQPVKEDEAFARQVWERLLERLALEEHRPLQKRTATFKAMGIVPLAESALFLHETGLANEGEMIESLEIHDWLMIQVSNTGEPGRRALLSKLEAETDPLVRIGIIQAIGSTREDFAREALLGILERGGQEPLEVLYTASRLIRVGPSWAAAPVLKRASYEMEGDIEARRALQCLLWHWY